VNPFEKRKRNRGTDFFYRLVLEARLIWRLIRDRRVPLYWKLIPAAVAGYLLVPFNILAPLDDIAITWVGLSIFIEVCPEEVVEEQRQALERVIPGTWRDAPRAEENREDDVKN
jgi:uncharacterized membrane protein YkvA (DUF1232 family)